MALYSVKYVHPNLARARSSRIRQAERGGLGYLGRGRSGQVTRGLAKRAGDDVSVFVQCLCMHNSVYDY